MKNNAKNNAKTSKKRKAMPASLPTTQVDVAGIDIGANEHWVAGPPDGEHANVRRMVLDMIEEYGRHVGHADLIRESVDGLVGEDPPDGWTP